MTTDRKRVLLAKPRGYCAYTWTASGYLILAAAYEHRRAQAVAASHRTQPSS